uniref:Major facilitator superfamily (MFS) profile domain-containing protein n=1 Tax=Amphimedon queenslandica TaxID=400682 RepID=A0A1X7T041_AMPQE
LTDTRYSTRRRSSLHEKRETLTCCTFSNRSKAYKNLLGTSASFVAVFGSYLGILGLQSSINSEAGLGLASSAVIYGTLIIACFFGPGMVKLLGTKYSLISGYILFFCYTLCNYYPSWYTLVIGAILNGIGQAPLWIAVFGHPIAIAVRYHKDLKETQSHAIAFFTGIIAASIKLAQIFGSLISSIILVNVDSTENNGAANLTNTSINNGECVDTFGPPIEPGPIYYTLISVYALAGIVGTIIAAVFLDHLGTEKKYLSAGQMCKVYVGENFLLVVKTFFNWKYLLIMPWIILNGVMLGFITGTFPKVYILDCVGIQWIGFVLAAYGVGGVFSSVFTGRIVRFIPQFVVAYAALSLSFALVMILLFWERQPNFVFLFGFPIGWGICESVYNSISPALLSQWFHDKEHEAALSLLQVSIAIGFIISFVGGIYLNTETRLWIITAFILLSSVTYTLVFFLTSCNKQQLLPCLYGGEVGERESGTEQREEEDVIQDYEVTDNGSPWNRFNPLSTRPSITVRDSHEIEEKKKEIEAREDEEGMRNGSSRLRNFKQSIISYTFLSNATTVDY